jgi:hypothetical protein
MFGSFSQDTQVAVSSSKEQKWFNGHVSRMARHPSKFITATFSI